MSMKLASTDTSKNDVSQSLTRNESDILLTKFVPEERTQDDSKEVENQGEFINFKLKFQHNYYASNNMNN